MPTQLQAKQWIQASIGKRYDTDGYYGAQLHRPILSLGQFSGFSGFFKRIISAKMNGLVINLYSRLPLTSAFVPDNTLHTSTIGRTKLAVSNVSSIRTDPEITLSVVKGIAANMIHDQSLRGVRNKTMQLNKFAVLSFFKVKLVITHKGYTPRATPIRDEIKIIVIKQCGDFPVLRTHYSKLLHIYQSIKCAPINQGGNYAYAN